jgi:CheY-like chemotaxis protein
VKSAPGLGSRFTVDLPLARALPDEAPAEALPSAHLPLTGLATAPRCPAHNRPADRQVLVVDDDETVCLLLTRLLRRAGLQTRSLGDPEQALLHLRDAGQVIDLVVSDYNMPRASGLDIALAAAARPRPPPVILISGHWNEAALAAAHALGVAAVLHKESAAEDLVSSALEALHAAQGG